MDTENIINTWLNDIVHTAADKNHKAHMELISKSVSLLGVPGFDHIGFDDWSNQCQHDFNDNMIDTISYAGLKIRAETDARIMFMTYETVKATDGSINSQGVECLLEKEEDGQWRLTQQRVLSDEETAQYQLNAN